MDKSNLLCRICGSNELNKALYNSELNNKLQLYELLRRDGSLDQLIRPCECRGGFAYAHKVCLSNWIETTKHEYCDICRFKYNVSFIENSIFDYIVDINQVEKTLKICLLAMFVYYLSALGIMITREQHYYSLLGVLVKTTSFIWLITCTIALIIISIKEFFNFKTWKQINRTVIVEENKNPQLDCEPMPKDVLKSSGFKPNDDLI